MSQNPASPSDVGDRLRRAAAPISPYPEGAFDGRGIVICAGGARLFTCAWIEAAMLRRHLGCTLPIEVWFLGPAEMGPPMRSLLEALDVHPVDALAVAREHPTSTLGGWQLKTFALLHCRFREVLLLDADNLPVRDPAALFELDEFARAGAMFWPDVVRLKPTNPIWALTGLTVDMGPSFESGQVLLDKARCWGALNLAHWINENHALFDDVLYGDKDAFYIAWRLTETPYHLIQHAPKRLEDTLCQRSPDGRILFQHRSGAKWHLLGPNPSIEGFRWEPECRALLAELSALWDGFIFNPPEQDPAALAAEQALAEIRCFRLVYIASDEREIELLPQHRVGTGANRHLREWVVVNGDAGLELCFYGSGSLRCVLRAGADGIWRGNTPTDHHRPVELHPAADSPASAPSRSEMLYAARRVLDAAAAVSRTPSALVTTLSVLASLDRDVAGFLKSCRADPGARASVAAAALAEAAEMPDLTNQAAPTYGTGWHRVPDSLETAYERVAKR